jgi:hypothetical protein
MKRAVLAALAVLALVGAAAGWYFRSGATRLVAVPAAAIVGTAGTGGHLPKTPRSVIIIVEENKSFDEIVGEPAHSPYLSALEKDGALFTQSYGVAHPSQPNYFALFAGLLNPDGDHCPASLIPHDAPNLGSELIAARRTFRAYVEDLPAPGFAGCDAGNYARKHAPWTHFTNVPPDDAVPFSALRSYETLPDLAFIIPNQLDDMHSGSVERGDAWLHVHIAPLIAWANAHNALVVITWDESNQLLTSHIPTLFIGPMVKPGRYDEVITHYRVLRTMEDLFGLPHAGAAAQELPILDVWR